MGDGELIIRTRRLVLRPLALSDLDTAHEYAGDPENTQYMVHLPNENKEETKRFLQKVAAEWAKDAPRFYEFAVLHEERHIGAVSVSLDQSGRIGELGWIIHKRDQGKGFGTEAAGAVMDFAIHTLKVHKIVAYCDYRNEPSCRVMRNIGLSLEKDDGVRRYRNSDAPVRELMYSLVVTSCPQNHR